MLKYVKISYHYNNQAFETSLDEPLKIACVKDQRKVFSSIDKDGWSEKIINRSNT